MNRNVKIISGVALLVIVMMLSFLLITALDTEILETSIFGKTIYTMEESVFTSVLLVAICSTVLCAIGAIVMIISGLRSKN